MGSCSSIAASDNSIPEAEEKAEEELITIVRSSDGKLLQHPAPVFLKDLMAASRAFAVSPFHKPLRQDTQLSFHTSSQRQPLLQPHKDCSGGDADEKPPTPELERTSGLQQRDPAHAPAAADTNSFKRLKSPKKVRFAEETEIISPRSDSGSSSQDEDSSCNLACNGKLSVHQDLSFNRQGSDGNAMGADDERPPTTQALNQRRSSNGVVRLKMVISRKDFTELMSPTTPQRRAEAMAARIMGPLLSSSPALPLSSCHEKIGYATLVPLVL